MASPHDLSLISADVKKAAHDAFFGLTSVNDPNRDRERLRAQLQYALTTFLHTKQTKREIDQFNIQVDVGEPVRLGERDIPPLARPGDNFGATGIVISSDGNGHGVVFDPHATPLDPDQVRIIVNYTSIMAVNYVTLDFKVSDTAY